MLFINHSINRFSACIEQLIKIDWLSNDLLPNSDIERKVHETQKTTNLKKEYQNQMGGGQIKSFGKSVETITTIVPHISVLWQKFE